MARWDGKAKVPVHPSVVEQPSDDACVYDPVQPLVLDDSRGTVWPPTVGKGSRPVLLKVCQAEPLRHGLAEPTVGKGVRPGLAEGRSS